MSEKRPKSSGASFRNAKKLKLLAASGEKVDKITSFFKTNTVTAADAGERAAEVVGDGAAEVASDGDKAAEVQDQEVVGDGAAEVQVVVGERAAEMVGDGDKAAEVVGERTAGHDIGSLLVSGTAFDDTLKVSILEDNWIPGHDYPLPHSIRKITGKDKNSTKTEKRFLRREHFERCPYLAFSASQQGLYCRPCVLFAPASGGAGRGGQKLMTLVTQPLTKFDRLFGQDGYLTTHESTDYHKTAVVRASEFRHNVKANLDIAKQVDTARSEQAASNRSFLRQIIKTVVFCGRYNVPLRGHRDDGPIQLTDDAPATNEGIFRGLLAFRVESGDIILENHLRSAAKNATYTSKTTQNALISSIGHVIGQAVVKRVRSARFFSVLADETTDSGRKEQLSLCLRYVADGKLCEDFLDFTEVTDLTGHGLGNSIMQEMRSHGLDLTHLVSQGYDGASAMSGALNGAQAVVQVAYPQAIYVHCANHVQNLSLSSGSSEQAVRNAMGVISSAANFFSRSAKRTTLLETVVTEKMPESKKQRLLQLCETRWVERHDAVLTFVELFDPLVTCLNNCLGMDKDTSTSAHMLLNSLSRPDFLVATSAMHQVLAVTKPLSVHLQKVGIDLVKAIQIIDETIGCLDEKRSAEDSFQEVWELASSLADVAGAELKQPRQAARQQNRVNIQSASDEEYFKRSVYLPFLDHVLSELRTRFSKVHQTVSHLWTLIPKFIASYSFADLQPALAIYPQFLESEQAVRGEFDMWKCRWAKADERPDTAIDALAACDSDLFPNISCLLQITATLPVTSASAERTFSVLKRLKTYLRSTMGEERLSGLAHMHIQFNLPIDTEAVIDHFSSSGSARRLNFII